MFKETREFLTNVKLKTRCLSCRKEIEETPLWFASQENPPCPFCGGDIDLEPLREVKRSSSKECEALEKAAMDSGETRH